jgi:hypothetical protein
MKRLLVEIAAIPVAHEFLEPLLNVRIDQERKR